MIFHPNLDRQISTKERSVIKSIINSILRQFTFKWKLLGKNPAFKTILFILAEIGNFRFGIVNAVKSVKSIKKDDEYFASYGYQMTSAPKWYRELYKKFAKENPDKADAGILDLIAEVEDQIAKGETKLNIAGISDEEEKKESNS